MTIRVFIENEAGSYIKQLYNEKTLKRIGSTRVSRPYPFPYGFVLDSTAEDGDNVDCFVLTDQLIHTGQILECEPLGLMEQIEDGEVDHKILATLPGEEREVNEAVRQNLVDFARHVFEHIPGKVMLVGGFGDKIAALQHLRETSSSASSTSQPA